MTTPKPEGWTLEYLLIDTRSFVEPRVPAQDHDIFLVIPHPHVVATLEFIKKDIDLVLLFLDLREKLAWVPGYGASTYRTHVLLASHDKLSETRGFLKSQDLNENGPIHVGVGYMPDFDDPINNPIDLKQYPLFLNNLMHFCGDIDWLGEK